MNRYGLIVPLLASAAAVPAFAQDGDPVASAPVENDVIVVTALKREQVLQDVPATINALGGETLKERQIQSLADLETQVAGLKFDPISGNSNVTVRGIGTTFTTGAGENSVSLHLDGIYISSPRAGGVGQFDLQRVEVLRGPQGTLYGKNSTAGIVNFISAAPTNNFEASVSLGYGNYDDKKGKLVVSGPLSDSVRARLYVEGGDRDGYAKNLTTGQDLDDLRYIGGRIGIDADISADWLMELRVTARSDEYAGPYFQPYDEDILPLPVPGTIVTPRVVQSPLVYEGDRDIILGSLRNTWNIGDVTLVSITGASKLKVEDYFDSLAQDPLVVPIGTDLTVETASQEFNLKGTSGNLDWLAGLFYYYERQDLESFVVLTPALTGAVFTQTRVAKGVAKRHSASIFGDGTYNITDRTRIFAGVRGLYERASNDLTVDYVTDEGLLLFTECTPDAPRQRVKDWSATGRVGVQHDFSDDVMAYSQYSRGYKSGGFSNNTCGNEYKPETVNALELGVKTRLFDGRVTFNAAGYYYQYDNLSVEQSTITGTFIVQAPGKLWGLDVDGSVEITDYLTIDGNATFLDSKYGRFPSSGGAPLGTPDGTDLRGNSFNKAPSASGTLGASLKLPVASGQLTLRGEGYFTSSYRLREYNNDLLKQDGYEIYNAYLTYRPNDTLTVRAFGRNLTKTDYLQGTVVEILGANGVYNAPRTYGVEVTLSMF